MADLPITFTIPSFPASFVGDPNALAHAIAKSLTATIPSTKLILGQIGGSAPASNVGPWLNGNSWYVWSSGTSSYIPAAIVMGDTANKITLISTTLTADRTVTFQDQSGTVALLSDIYTPRPTVTLSGATPSIDFSASTSFYLNLTANATMTTTGSQPGQTIAIAINNSATYTVSWGSLIQWPGGTTPTQTTTGKDLYILKNLAGTIYGRQIANYS